MNRRKKTDEARAERLARAIVGGRDEQMCVRCRRGSNLGTNFDHRKNRSQGGKWAASNGQLLCGSGTTGCHGWKTQNPQTAMQDGYTCPSWAEPTEWPARRWLPTPYGTQRLTWVLYDDRGNYTPITTDEARHRMAHVWPTTTKDTP